MTTQKNYLLWILSTIAVLFGLLTLKSSYLVLFTQGEFHQSVGNYLPFVVAFNGIAGFFYIISGVGLFFQKKWAAIIAALIALATLIVFALFFWQISQGAAYENRTLYAMSFRSALWILISWLAWKKADT